MNNQEKVLMLFHNFPQLLWRYAVMKPQVKIGVPSCLLCFGPSGPCSVIFFHRLLDFIAMLLNSFILMLSNLLYVYKKNPLRKVFLFGV